MGSHVSLVNKCLAIFGTAIVIIIASTLAVPWIRSDTVVQDYQLEVARQLADQQLETEGFEDEEVSITLYIINEMASGDSFVHLARDKFTSKDPDSLEYFGEFASEDDAYFLYARPITQSQLASTQWSGVTDLSGEVLDPGLSDPFKAIMVVRRNTTFARGQLNKNRNWIIVSGIVGSIFSGLVYFFILKRLIFSPVRKLRRVSEQVQQGDFTARSSLETGDEFEELSTAFNEMLDRMSQDQKKLEKINESLDFKVEELAETNVGLFESSKLKNEFLANVSHELRTPLNSIIGFAELLDGMEADSGEDESKRKRYLRNILTSGHSLLGMINELLDMAKIEAGRMEVHLEPTSVTDVLEGLCGIMRPQAKAAQITLELQIQDALPSIQTDPGKLQQILYNYLSNAIKFSPPHSVVIVNARASELDEDDSVQIGVIDQGPGIPEDMIDMVFEKFRQVDATHTREHAGTGLGLAICRELAELLHAHLFVQSKTGDGASFYVEVPVMYTAETPEALMPE